MALDPENFAHVFSVLLPSLCRLFFFARHLGFCFFGGYLGVKRSCIFGEKNQNKENIPKTLGKGILNACKISWSNSQKRRGRLDFSAVKCKNHGLAS